MEILHVTSGDIAAELLRVTIRWSASIAGMAACACRPATPPADTTT
jgi:hypothetical protein